MLRSVDVEKGQVYEFKLNREVFRADFIKTKPDGNLVFKSHVDGVRFPIDRNDFIAMRALHGTAILLDTDASALPVIEPGAQEPELPSDNPKVKALKKKYRKAYKRKFILQLIDETKTSHSVLPIRKLLRTHKDALDKLGPEKVPGASTIIKYLRLFGTPGNRPLVLFLGNGGGHTAAGPDENADDRNLPWKAFVQARLWKMVAWYYSKDAPSDTLVKKICRGEIAAERVRRLELHFAAVKADSENPVQRILVDDGKGVTSTVSAREDGELFPTPVPATFQNWLDRNASGDNLDRRENRKIRAFQVEGNQWHVTAQRPLEVVAMDHTQIDMFVVILDIDGKVIRTFRPYLIVVVDVYSRMVLAANLTEEPPSLYTLKEGLKQALKPKGFLEGYASSSSYFWATDGWGMYRRMLVDNGLENVGVSLKASADSVGIDLSFAPVATPQFKAICERFFHTINTGVWHQADGGVPHKPGVSKDDPRKKAFLTLDAAQEKLWNWIVTKYHLSVHDELEMAPARKWSIGFKTYKRPMVTDMNLIDNVFGKYVTRDLTTGGIKYNGEVYHDPQLTGDLIADLLHLNRNKHRGRDRYQSAKIKVRIVDSIDDRQLSYITVYNPVRRSYVRLPNRVSDRSGTYAQRDLERQLENRENENFFSQDQVAINDAIHLAGMTRISTPDMTGIARSGANHSWFLDGGEASKPKAAPIKFDSHNSEYQAAIHSQTNPLEPRPAARRGGKAATKKAAEGRRRKQAENLEKATLIEEKLNKSISRPAASRRTPTAPTSHELEAAENIASLLAAGAGNANDPSALRERLRAKLKGGG